jgi:uncharacterized protein (TIGR03435 family)
MKLVCASILLAAALAAQGPSFEATSIKPNRSDRGGSSIRVSKGRVTMENVTLRKLTLWAYGIPDDREYALIGPGWLGADRFDIVATFAGDSQAEVLAMTRRLLSERFRLAGRLETRQLPTFALVAAKNGPKIRPAEDGAPKTESRPGRLDATRITTGKLCDLFARMVGRPVKDETGLAGLYSFTLEWTPDETQRAAPPEDGQARASGASLFAAVEEQLGLKLEGRKGAVDVLVVDHVERTPTEN